jgi:hypothetical protein
MENCLHTERFESTTIILPLVNETTSLEQTVDLLLRDVSREDIKELLIVTCKKTTAESRAVAAKIQKKLGSDFVAIHEQTLPFLGGAIREAFDLSRGSHTILMASDLETDPHDAAAMIAEAKTHPSAIITATRWTRGGEFHGYSKIKLVCNWMFQHFFSALYGTKLTDLTFAYRIFPTKLVRAIRWEDLRHSFLFETIVKPLRLGVEVIEVPSNWHARVEGESQNPFFRNFEYFNIGLRTQFASRKSVLRPEFVSALKPEK